MNQKLLQYITEVGRTFHVNEEIEKYNQMNSFEDKPNLVFGLSEKSRYLENWNRLLVKLRLNTKGKVRDITLSGQRNSFKALLTYSNEEGYDVGITVCISFPFKLFGFAYSRFEHGKNEKDNFLQNTYDVIEYGMNNVKACIENLVIENFIGFIEFEYEYASFTIERIVIDDLIYNDLDLWEVIFNTNVVGII